MKKLLSAFLGLAMFVMPLAAFGQTMTVGRIVGTSAAPVLTACGGGSPAVVGTDLGGTITSGTTSTGCVLTFSQAYAVAPHCVVSWRANLASMQYVVAAATITITQTSGSGQIIDYVCVGQN